MVFEILKTALQGMWVKDFDGASIHDQPDDEELAERAMVHVIDTKIKIRIKHFSWWTTALSYFIGSQTMQMEMYPYMHPPQVKDTDVTDVIHLTVYAVREDQSQVFISKILLTLPRIYCDSTRRKLYTGATWGEAGEPPLKVSKKGQLSDIGYFHAIK